MLLMQLYVKIGDILTNLHDHIISLRVTLLIRICHFPQKRKAYHQKLVLDIYVTEYGTALTTILPILFLYLVKNVKDIFVCQCVT